MTRNTYIFGIGGTGARVIRALTMLLAAGARLQHNGKLIPIIIDVDAENEDTARTIKALDLYKNIRMAAYRNDAEQVEGLFGAPVNTLGSQQTDDTQSISDGFQLKFAGIGSTFAKYIRVHDMEGIDEEFLKLLYDSSPEDRPEAELNLSLSKGFKGNPNIGCVVFNELEQTSEFKYFCNAIGENDRIFIVSSIFGGTGSAGFPQLVKLLKASNSNRVSSAITGALTIMPYFSVQEDSESAIDSNKFMSKTKAALSYYEHEMDALNAIYYLYDKAGSIPYANNEGGKAQKNDAHLIEYIAATAILDFTNKKGEAFDTTLYHEYGVKKDMPIIDIRDFFDQDKNNVLYHLTKCTYAAKVYTEYVPSALDEAFAKELGLDKHLFSASFYQNLTSFFKLHYLEWLAEMERNDRKFKPFNLNEKSLNTLVVGKPIKTSTFVNGISDSYLNKHFGKIENELKKTMPEGEKRFLYLLNMVAEKCYEKLEHLPS